MERLIAATIITGSFLALGAVALSTTDTIEYGDGCYSNTDSPLIVICPTEVYTADLSIVLELCPTEDSDNCYWNADILGNGTGRSFYTYNGLKTYL